MKLFMFKSQKNQTLGAFAANPNVHELPTNFAPWVAVGVVRPEMQPPHKLDRQTIEAAIAAQGFQLFRLAAKTAVTAH